MGKNKFRGMQRGQARRAITKGAVGNDKVKALDKPISEAVARTPFATRPQINPGDVLLFMNASGGIREVGLDERVSLSEPTSDGGTPRFITVPESDPRVGLARQHARSLRKAVLMADVHTAVGSVEYGRYGDPGTLLDERMQALIGNVKDAKRDKRTFLTLADLASDPGAYVRSRSMLSKPSEMRSFRVLTLDDQSTRAAVRLASTRPHDILEMLQVARPPWKKLWVEMPSRTLLEERQNGSTVLVGAKVDLTTRKDHHRIAFKIESHDDFIVVTLFEHTEDDRVFEWPVGFRIALEDSKLVRPKTGEVTRHSDGATLGVQRGKTPLTEQSGLLWGYGKDTPGLSQLNNKAQAQLLEADLPMFQDAAHRQTVMSTTLKEVSGTTRTVVAVLAMLNTVMQIDPPNRPKGRRVVRNGTVAYVERSVSYLNIGHRIRDVDRHIRKAVRDEVSRRRYHEVRGHYRHVSRKPSTPGWTEVQVDGRTMWRKHIAEHHRGDIELGVVAHDVTVVTHPERE